MNKNKTKEISPFFLLTLPFYLVLFIMAIHAGSEMVLEEIPVAASFFRLPEVDIFRVLFAR